jgi:hypothetical protein
MDGTQLFTYGSASSGQTKTVCGILLSTNDQLDNLKVAP